MKFCILILQLIFCSILYGQDYYFVNAENGLNIRADKKASSEKLGKLACGTMVEKIADTNITLTENDNGKKIEGKWVKIKYNNYLYLVSKEKQSFEREGFVFDGYLTKIKEESFIDFKKIEKAKYEALKQTASKTIYKPKKIANLDSIKIILKDRVEWVTDFEEGMEREDALKSILIDNGQKLIINQVSNDYGFSDFSAYYPEHEILVLEGGHGSNMSFSIKTGETDATIGNPEYIIPSPNNLYRLNGAHGGQECISYFFQKKSQSKFTYLTSFHWDFDNCIFKEFYWITDNTFIYIKYESEQEYFFGELK